MNGVPLIAYLALGLILFAIGSMGVVIRRSPIVIFMCVELMLNAVNLTALAFARYLPQNVVPAERGHVAVTGEMLVVFVMAVAAAEVAVGLGIIMAIFRLRESTDIDQMTTLRG